MLKSFEVSGYRNFNNTFKLDFSDVRDYQFNKQCVKDGLLNNIIIYGKNAVGKTNLGRALFDIKNNFQREILMEKGSDSYLNADSDLGFAEFRYVFTFSGTEVVYEYRKKTGYNILYEKLCLNKKIIFEYNHQTKEKVVNNLDLVNAGTLNWEFSDDEISILSYITNNVQLGSSEILKKLYSFIKGMQFTRGNTGIMFSSMYNAIIEDIIKNDWVNDFQKFLNHFGVQENLIVVDLPIGEKMLCFNHKKPIPFIGNCSSGTISLIRLYSWYKRTENESFLYMDEFDAFYHYELSERVIKLFSELQHCQTIVTSHNTNLLSNKIMRPDCFFILTKEKLVSIINATDRELREGHNLEKLYKSGEFGE
jgi:AAA15 family ATPase/GTPase